jgi:hypothetical protein
MPAPDSPAEHVWWERIHRAAAARGDAGSKLRGDWSHAMLRVQCPDASGFGYELIEGRRVPVTPEMFTEAYQQAQCRRLCDQLGRRLGVGPMP